MSNDQDNVNRKKMLERVRKLLAMAKDASSPNEAAIAARRAKALMEQYAIDNADVLTGGLSPDDFIEGVATKPMVRCPVHLSVLSLAVANYCRVHSLFDWHIEPPNFKPRKVIKFQGHKDDMELARYLYTYLSNEIDRLCNRSGVKGVGPRTIFKKACASEIANTLRHMLQEEDVEFQADRKGKAMVLLDKKRVMLRDKFGVQRTRSHRWGISDKGAYAAGREAGASVSIRKGVNGGRNARLIGKGR